MAVVVVLISRLKSGECGSMCPLKREQAKREMQQWFMRRLPTADCIMEIGRKSRSWINVTHVCVIVWCSELEVFAFSLEVQEQHPVHPEGFRL